MEEMPEKPNAAVPPQPTIVQQAIAQVAIAEGQIGAAVSSKKISGRAGEMLRERFVDLIYSVTVQGAMEARGQKAKEENPDGVDQKGD